MQAKVEKGDAYMYAESVKRMDEKGERVNRQRRTEDIQRKGMTKIFV